MRPLSFVRLEQVSPRSFARSLSLARVRLLRIPRHKPGGSIHPLVNITPPPIATIPSACLDHVVSIDGYVAVATSQGEHAQKGINNGFKAFILPSFFPPQIASKMNSLTSLNRTHP